MDIQQLHIENNAYRDLINSLKEKINQFDRRIKANEIEIGKQLNEMERMETESDCTLCMGPCDVHN